MKSKYILTVLTVAIAAFTQPALAEFTQNKNGEITHVNGISLPPMQTVEEARAQAQKEITAANKAREAVQAIANQLATRNTLPATPPQEIFYTGKPYIEETGQYVFLFRSYDSELSRWTTADPSGFPDGANNFAYMAVPTTQFDWQGLKTGLIMGLDITLRVLRSNEWVDITDGGSISKSTDTRFELVITSEPYDTQFMLAADKSPLGGYAIDKDPSGEIYPSLANQSISGIGLPSVSGASYWQPRYWPSGDTYPMVKLDGSISSMLVGGNWNALVLYNPNSDPSPLSWSVGGSIIE